MIFFVLWNRCYLLAEIWNCALNLLWVSERGKFLTLFTSLVILWRTAKFGKYFY